MYPIDPNGLLWVILCLTARFRNSKPYHEENCVLYLGFRQHIIWRFWHPVYTVTWCNFNDLFCIFVNIWFLKGLSCVFSPELPLSLWHRGHQGLIMKYLQLSVFQGVCPENWGWNKSNFSFRNLRESNFIQLELIS